jgi:SpoVK/Ycf46/Vps4 family AAA+-type ATPase
MTTGSVEYTIDDAEFENLAALTTGHSGCDIASLAREAAMAPVREHLAGLSLTLETAAVSAHRGSPNNKRQRLISPTAAAGAGPLVLRAVTAGDFVTALDFVTASCKQPGWSEEE